MVDNFINNKIEIKNPKFENNSNIMMAAIFYLKKVSPYKYA